MASSKPTLAMVMACLLLVFLPVVDVDAQVDLQDPSVMARSMRMRSLLQAPKIECPATCAARCSGNRQYNKMCNKMCNVCCGKCNCVPPGTGQGTRHLCPCYDTMTNPHNGHLKCP